MGMIPGKKQTPEHIKNVLDARKRHREEGVFADSSESIKANSLRKRKQKMKLHMKKMRKARKKSIPCHQNTKDAVSKANEGNDNWKHKIGMPKESIERSEGRNKDPFYMKKLLAKSSELQPNVKKEQ